jgi:probable F420-dependent oxidoreductase
MKFALHFANNNFPDGAGAKRLATAAETAGFDQLLVIEHVVWPTHYASVYPYNPSGKLPGGPQTKLPDPLIWMAYAAAVTTRLRFLTGVLILPQRNPVVLAKELATLDYMSGGRVDLGVGIGWLREEMEAIGVPFAQRGARTDEYIEAMRALWDNDDASYAGKFVDFKGMSCNPKPVHGRVPIIIGGHSEAAARRAARLGDGFFPATGSPVDIAPLIALMKQQAAHFGRDPAAIEVVTGCPGALPGSGSDPKKAVADAVSRGVARVVLPLAPFMTGDLEANLSTFGESVIREFRS